MKEQAGHIRELEGFRGFLALWVLFSHTAQLSGFALPSFLAAAHAVTHFMVLSGFLMLRNHPEGWRDFYLRRFFRIAPAYYLLLVPAVFLLPFYVEWRAAIDSAFHLQPRTYGDATWANGLAHLTFIFGSIPRFSFVNVIPDWSLGLEMQFYLVFPLLAFLVRKLPFLPLTLGVLGVSWVASREWGSAFPMPSFLLLRMAAFWAGMALAVALGRGAGGNRGRFTALGLALLCIATVNRVLLWQLVVFLALLAAKRPIFRFLRAFDEISYSLYLCHLLVIIPLLAWLIREPDFLGAAPVWRWLFTLVPGALVSGGLAYLVSRWVERPGMAFGRRLFR